MRPLRIAPLLATALACLAEPAASDEKLFRFGVMAEEAQEPDRVLRVYGAFNALLGRRLAPHGIRVEIAPDLPSVQGDRQRLTEVLQNLVENAAKFTGEQANPRIEIGWRVDGVESVFYVQDNGTGFDERFKDRVFGLFEKLDPRSEGTGIGLALARRIVEAHGGRIWAESAGPGRGATFCFTLGSPAAGAGAAAV